MDKDGHPDPKRAVAGPFHRVRRTGSSLSLAQARLLFLLFALAMAVPLGVLLATRGPVAPAIRGVACATLIGLLCWWIRGFHRGRFPAGASVVEALALFLLMFAVGDPHQALGFLFAGLFFRSLNGSLRTTAVHALLVILAYGTALTLYQSQTSIGLVARDLQGLGFDVATYRLSPGMLELVRIRDAQELGFEVPTLFLSALLMGLLTQAVQRQEQVTERQSVLATMSTRLVAAQTPAEMVLAGNDALRALVGTAAGMVGRLWLTGADGSLLEAPADTSSKQGSEPDRPLETLTAAVRNLLDAARQPVGAAVPAAAFQHALESALPDTRATPRLLMAVPVVAGDRLRGALVVTGSSTGANSRRDALTMLASVLGLALERRDRSEASFRAIAQHASDVILILGADGQIRSESPAAERSWGYAAGCLTNTSTLDLVSPDQRAVMQQLLAQVLADPLRTITSELQLRDATSKLHTCEVAFRNLLADVDVAGVVLTCHDITERAAYEQELQRLAFEDTLTHLPNRALFLDRLAHALQRTHRRGQSLAVLFLDLDNFKVVNDSLGHPFGDELLCVVGERLQQSLGPGNTAARFGGDEFTIVLEDVATEAEAIAIAEHLRAAVRKPLQLAGNELAPSCSIGIALSTAEAETPDILLRNADLALYRAKVNGKAQYALFRPEMTRAAMARLKLEADLRRALSQGELRLLYQPIVELDSERVTEVEALVRWQHPTLGLIQPTEFIPMAEETGLILPLGEWVLETACHQAASWQAQNPQPPIMSVNLSARQFQDPRLLEKVTAALKSAGLPADRLKVEVTESAVMQDAAAAARTLEQLKRLGVRLAIDDFGTGYSSLSYLKQFPVDTLKIDRMFVEGLATNANDSAIVRSVVELAKGLNLSVTGEGVETQEQLEELRALGCDRGQGFLFAHPITAEAMAGLLLAAGAGRQHVAA